ncbi:MAG: glycosyltransferase family 2 protein [Phycisphaerales bacterium]|nr:glycosyltransferase family 2 protein [Planctomycetota bacterium]MCH8508455.1 glycosyltransferase family 2 protein [Phycisphaerales bacterium]
MDVSILIPVYNRVSLTRACLDSLFETLPDGLETEVFVYDDRSTDATRAYLATQAHRVTAMRGETRGSFAKNNNAMARRARGRYLVLLNNDTVLTPGWLEPMLELAAEPSVGVVANWHTVPGSTTVNHAGVVFDDQHRDRRLYEGMDLEGLAHARRPRELQAVIAACCVTPADLYRRLGGLDEAYRTGYEDLEYCFRARELGRAVLCTGASVIGHHGGSSPGRFETDTANRRLFHERWDGVVRPDLAEQAMADRVAWPSETVAYKVCRSVWRTPVAQVVMGPMLRTSIGVRARQRVHRLVSLGGAPKSDGG